MSYFKLILSGSEYKSLLLSLKGTKLEKIIRKAKPVRESKYKKIAMEKATRTRINRTLLRIEHGIEMLQKTKSRVTISSIADKGSVAYNSVRKYVSNKRLMELNKNYILN